MISTPTKHAWTPGPWSRYNDGPSSNIFLESTKNGSVCKLANNSHAEANAKLIAKAPEMANLLLKLFNDESAMCEIPAITVNEIKELLREAGAL